MFGKVRWGTLVPEQETVAEFLVSHGSIVLVAWEDCQPQSTFLCPLDRAATLGNFGEVTASTIAL
eukprot:1313710-Ditylum_brightwellii.AAC.1